MTKDEILMKIATGIETKCGVGGCPCKSECKAMNDKECFDNIIGWLEQMIEAEPFEEE